MKLSNFGKKFSQQAGIISLMDDLGHALSGNQPMIMMGGGNPSHIPEIERVFKLRLQKILDDPTQLHQLIGVYDPPQGPVDFLKALVKLLRHQFGWAITERNIMLTNGSQSAFFMLFNLLAGACENGVVRKIQFPLAPEYIGYSDVGITDHFFNATCPNIEMLDDHFFKYRVNFHDFVVNDDTGAICVSRPTNPTGNVITDDELHHLDALAKQANVPLIIDSAYGTPFPNLIYTQATPMWNENTVVCMSLSKFGLPAARTGIVIANEEMIHALSSMNAIINLATGSTGSLLALDMIKSGEILHLSNQVVNPHYQHKMHLAVDALTHAFTGSTCPYAIHKPEGSMFLWLWFKELPITSLELYERLKKRGVLVVSGHYFFPGMEDNWRHQHECIRVTYSQDEAQVQQGIALIADEIKSIYANGK
jgi:valine--pyruvate aminotransferase